MTKQNQDISEILKSHKGQQGTMLPILHSIQEAFGFIPEDAIDPIAEALGRSRAEVYGVISFYHDFKITPEGVHKVQICRAEACQSVGAEGLVKDMLSAFGLEDFGTTADGKVTVEAVYCLGLCPLSPAAMVNGKPMARASVKKVQGAVS